MGLQRIVTVRVIERTKLAKTFRNAGRQGMAAFRQRLALACCCLALLSLLVGFAIAEEHAGSIGTDPPDHNATDTTDDGATDHNSTDTGLLLRSSCTAVTAEIKAREMILK